MNNKILASTIISGVLALVAGMAGCSAQVTRQGEILTKDLLLEKAFDTFTNMKSMDADIHAGIDVVFNATGLKMEMISNTDLNAEGTTEGSHIKGNMRFMALGQDNDVNVENYTVKEGNEYTSYSKVSDSTTEGKWTYVKTGIEVPESEVPEKLSEMSITQIANAYKKLKDSFSDLTLHDDTVSYNNISCYLMDGTIKGDKLSELISSSGETVDEETMESMKLMDIDTALYFRANDQTPYALEMDLSKAMDKIIASQSDLIQEMEVSTDEMKFTIVINSFNDVEEIKVPDSVKNSAVEGVDLPDVQSLMGIDGML